MAITFSDTELIEKIARSDSSAFHLLYRKHYNMVKYFVEQNNGAHDDAADLFQEVLIIIFEKIRDKKLTLTCSLKTYIYSVARNQWLKKLKEKKNHVSLKNFEEFILVEEEQEVSPVVDLKNLINEIGEACRKLLVLFYYRKKSMEEICLELNYANADTAKNQKYKCIQRLKKMVADKR